MTQPITDCAAFLSEAKRAVTEITSYIETESSLRMEEKRLEKELEAEKRFVADTISQTIKKRTEQINSSYDQEISRGQDRLKKVRGKREKAKNQGVKERIAEETSELHDYNRELRAKMKSEFQQNAVPWFCNSKWYYSLYFTRGFSEAMVLILTILVCFLVIPYAAYMLIPGQNPVYLIGIYFVTIVVFGGLYIAISNVTKVRHLEALKEGRSIRNLIVSNNKKIHVITTTITRDKNETVYDLERFDDEIAKIENELFEVSKKKKEALNTFDSVTSTIIADEITGNSKNKIDQLQSDYDKTVRDVQSLDAQIKEKSLYIADHYEIYLDKDLLHPDLLESLSEIIESGQAKNLSDAVSIFRSTHI